MLYQALIQTMLWFILLGLTEGLVKPIASATVRRFAFKHLPEMIDYLDRLMPVAISQMSAADLQAALITKYEELAEEPIPPSMLEEIARRYSPFKNIKKLNG